MGGVSFGGLIFSFFLSFRANHLVSSDNCPAGADGNLQCCNIPRVTSFHSTNEQANFEYFKSASVPDLSFQPSEEGSSDDTLNGLNQYFENTQVPAGDIGLNLHSPAQPVTGNNFIGYYEPPAGGSDPWAEAWE